MLKHTISKCR